MKNRNGSAQGDASLAGAAYGIYKDSQLMDVYYTDENGQFTTDYYVCGNDWTIREITPSEGYLIDSTVYPVGAEAKNYSIELNNAPAADVTERVTRAISLSSSTPTTARHRSRLPKKAQPSRSISRLRALLSLSGKPNGNPKTATPSWGPPSTFCVSL